MGREPLAEGNLVGDIRRIDLYPNDALIADAALSDLDFGIYWRACLAIYARNGPITIAHLRALCRSHGNAFSAAITRLVDAKKLEVSNGEIDQKRCRNELKTVEKRLRNLRENGSKGGRPNGLGKPTGSDHHLHHHQNLKEEIDSPLSAPPLESPLTAPPSAPPTTTPKAKDRSNAPRGSRLPSDWRPDAACSSFASGLGLDPEGIADEFRDYWHSKPGAGGVKIDWCATWRNWCRKAAASPGLQRANGHRYETAVERIAREGREISLRLIAEARERERADGVPGATGDGL